MCEKERSSPDLSVQVTEKVDTEPGQATEEHQGRCAGHNEKDQKG